MSNLCKTRVVPFDLGKYFPGPPHWRKIAHLGKKERPDPPYHLAKHNRNTLLANRESPLLPVNLLNLETPYPITSLVL